jgi:hypothetical protein
MLRYITVYITVDLGGPLKWRALRVSHHLYFPEVTGPVFRVTAA